MAGLLGYIAAGAAQGVGNAMVEEAKAKRAEALATLDYERTVAREDRSREFTRQENDRNRMFTAEQSRITRENSGDAMTLEDGTIGVRQGTTIKPLTGPDGKPVKGMPKASGGDAPADVQTAEWLITKGVAKNPTEAFNMVRQARTDPEKSRASIFNKWIDALTKNSYGKVDGNQIRAEAERLTNETLMFLEQSDTPAAPDGAGPAASKPAAPAGPAGVAVGGKQSTAKGARYPEAPKDKAARKVGQVYLAPDGRKVRWQAGGWEVVE